MQFLAYLTLPAVVWIIVAGPWYLAPPLYLLGGVLWIIPDRRRPFNWQSMAYTSRAGTMLMLIVWPLRAIHDLRERWQLLRSPQRYAVVGDGEITRFRHWDDAVEAARKSAVATAQRVMVSDTARLAMQFGMMQEKSWFVVPDGRIVSLPRRLRVK